MSRVVRGLLALLPLALVGAPLAPALAAQSQYSVEVVPGKAAPDPFAANVPFGPGERLEYQVKLGVFSAGEGFMAVEGVDTIPASVLAASAAWLTMRAISRREETSPAT